MPGDPVADKSSFLCMYMSNHPDTLVAYVRHWGGVAKTVESASMTTIDSKGMTLSYTVKGVAKKESVRVAFDPPLAGYDEVKPRLMTMTAVAQEELGMTRAPQISSFRLPAAHSILQVVALLGTIAYATFDPAPAFALLPFSPSTIANVDLLFDPARALRARLTRRVLPIVWTSLLLAHIGEALYTLSLCRKHRTGFIVGAQYVLLTFILGYPVWTDFLQQVQTARIESIMKGQ